MSEAARTLDSAEIIAVGNELLTPWRVDTNSLFITRLLEQLGIEVRSKLVLGDDRAAIAAAVRAALRRVRLVITTGGLGPTDDDRTRDAVAAALGRTLALDETIVDRMRQRFEALGRAMPEVNRRQAWVPRDAIVLENPVGTAPGLWIEDGEAVVLLLPGPPRELNPMLERLVAGRLADRAGAHRLHRRVIRVTGLSESEVEQMTQPIYVDWLRQTPPIETTILASPGQIELHLQIRTPAETDANGALDRAVSSLADVLGDRVVSTDGRTLAEVVGARLRALGATIAAAESCTGGLLMARLTDVPGSSEYVTQGVVTYANDAKVALVGVPRSLLEAHGAVSEPVASAMARGVRARAATDVGVGITGIAGPGGGSPQKPVGTVAIAVDGPGDRHRVRTTRFPGDRQTVRRQATEAALDLVRGALDGRG